MRRLLLSLAVVAATSPALAQLGNPAGTKPQTPEAAPGQPRPGEPNADDRLFVQLLAVGGLGEVESGRLASSRARTSGVKTFAQRMVQDHSAAGDRLAGLARQAGIPLPGSLDPDRQALRRELDAAPPENFDALYLRGQLIEHQKTVQLLEWEIGSGQDAHLQRLAGDLLPAVLEHLQMAQQLFASVTGAQPQGLGPAPMSH